MQSLLKLSNKKGNEVGPEVVDEIESERVNVVSNTQLKVQPSDFDVADKPLGIACYMACINSTGGSAPFQLIWHAEGGADWRW